MEGSTQSGLDQILVVEPYKKVSKRMGERRRNTYLNIAKKAWKNNITVVNGKGKINDALNVINSITSED
jgi:thymidylate kinase